MTLFSSNTSDAAPTASADAISRPRRRLGAGSTRRREALAAYAFLAPGFLLFAVVVVYPIARAFQISLYQWSLVPAQASHFLGVDNYTRAFHDPIFWRALENTAFYMAATVPAQLALGLVAAVLLDARIPGRAVFRTLFYLPVVMSWVVVALLFQYLFQTNGGLVNWVLHDALHATSQNVAWFDGRWTGMAAVSVLGVWKGIGWAMVIFLAALQGVPRELHEAAAVDGASPWRRFRAVSLPAIRPVIAFVTVMLVIGGFNVFISVFLMTHGGPLDETQVLLSYMYRQAFTFLDFGYGSAISFILTVIVLGFSLVQLRLFRRPEAA